MRFSAMNKKQTALICLFSGVIILLTVLLINRPYGKTVSAKNEAFYTFTDSLGNEVVLAEKPERVAVLFSSLCNVWKNAGGEALITVGESIERGFCDEATALVDSGAGKSINTELLISLEPDFVIYSSDVPAQKNAGELLSKSGVPSAAIRLDSFADYLSALEIFCDITGKRENYILYGEKVKAEADLIIKEARQDKLSPKILFVRSGSSQSSCKAKKADDNFAAKMLEELGCINIADKAPVLIDGLSAEVVLKENPDYIFISLMGDEELSRAFMEKTLEGDAYKKLDSKIIFLPKELFQYKPCEKWADAYAFLRNALNNPDTKGE